MGNTNNSGFVVFETMAAGAAVASALSANSSSSRSSNALVGSMLMADGGRRGNAAEELTGTFMVLNSMLAPSNSSATGSSSQSSSGSSSSSNRDYSQSRSQSKSTSNSECCKCGSDQCTTCMLGTGCGGLATAAICAGCCYPIEIGCQCLLNIPISAGGVFLSPCGIAVTAVTAAASLVSAIGFFGSCISACMENASPRAGEENAVPSTEESTAAYVQVPASPLPARTNVSNQAVRNASLYGGETTVDSQFGRIARVPG